MHQPNTTGKLALLIGPSGVGKSVIFQKLKKRNPNWHFPKSATTRARREGEGDEIYYFITEEEFSEWEAQGKFLETATVHGYARYGTLVAEIIPPIEQGKIVLREVDVQGFLSLRDDPRFQDDTHPLLSIFLVPESIEQLKEHVRKRSPVTEEELDRRMASVEKEMKHADECTAKVVSREGKLYEAMLDIERIILGRT